MLRLALSFSLIVAFCLVSFSQEGCDFPILGQVLDAETNKPLAFATIRIVNTEKGTISNEIGKFVIEDICEEEVDLEVRYLGYKTVTHHHDFYHGEIVIKLASDKTVLESVIVEERRTDQLESIAIKGKEVNNLSLVTTSIGDLTEQLSGVSTLKTGSNVSKPIVHGLHSNRVLVINDGVRHAYQTWGEDHAIEIDPSRIDQIEVLKGAGTVKYGPDALGGVILYNSKKPNFNTKINGSIGNSYQTNGRAYTSQFSLGQGFQRFSWNVNGFGVYQGDMRAPHYNLSNTGKREYGGSFKTLMHQPKFDLEISGSYLEQKFGILRASIVGNLVDLQNAIDNSIPKPTFSNTYNIQNPRQDTKHALLRSDLSIFVGSHIFNIQYAFQNNIRREYDVRRGELNERPVIFLDLISQTLETSWTQPKVGRWSGNSGVQIFTKNSVNEPASNPMNFVPDYNIFNFGTYTIQSINLDKTILEMGARFDLQTLKVRDTIRDVFIYNNKLNFSNATFTIGIKRKINRSLALFSNIGSAWRPPNVAELYAFGYRYSRISFGLWRYELTPEIVTPINGVFDETTRKVASEKSYKWVSGLEWKGPRLSSEFILYGNLINDYIYSRPFGITVNVAGTFPFFIYEQTNALLIGADWDIQYDHSKDFSSELKLSYVYGWEKKNNQPLIEVPPLNIDYSFNKKGKLGYGLRLNYTTQQWLAPSVINPREFDEGKAEVKPEEIFDFMPPPKGFLLVGGEVSYTNGPLKLNVKVSNLFDTSYRIYTDRLRYFSDALGRNLALAIEWKF